MATVDRARRARELCRRLKPVIGHRAERIWQAFVAENENGREQLLDYLELLAARHFQSSLEGEEPLLLPADAAEALGEYRLGTVTYNNKPLHPFGLRENEWIQHVGIFG